MPPATDGAEALLPWLPPSSGRPTVYFTLGTVFNTESGDLFTRVLSGLRELPIEVVVTVGRDVDPAGFGPQPGHIHIERYIPQAALLPHCDLVINHGGSGSVIGALAHGLPLVVIPMGADQSLNATRCAQLGVGVALDAVGPRLCPSATRSPRSWEIRPIASPPRVSVPRSRRSRGPRRWCPSWRDSSRAARCRQFETVGYVLFRYAPVAYRSTAGSLLRIRYACVA